MESTRQFTLDKLTTVMYIIKLTKKINIFSMKTQYLHFANSNYVRSFTEFEFGDQEEEILVLESVAVVAGWFLYFEFPLTIHSVSVAA